VELGGSYGVVGRPEGLVLGEALSKQREQELHLEHAAALQFC
jgi:hypothetical protein